MVPEYTVSPPSCGLEQSPGRIVWYRQRSPTNLSDVSIGILPNTVLLLISRTGRIGAVRFYRCCSGRHTLWESQRNLRRSEFVFKCCLNSVLFSDDDDIIDALGNLFDRNPADCNVTIPRFLDDSASGTSVAKVRSNFDDHARFPVKLPDVLLADCWTGAH